MGACATKPKGMKAESGEAPEELPAETKPDHVGDEKAKEIVVDDDKVDSKPRSLSNLFIDDQKEGNKEKTEGADPPEKQETNPPETEKQIDPLPEEKPSENNPPEPAVSDSVTENNTVISSEKLMETPNEENKEIDPKNEDKIKVEVTTENDVPPEKTESSEKPTETEKEVKVIN
ncbi:pollen-specific leucine-rich repeat extensin-like protein 1 isoform X1 [Cucumis melo var. makuwa]|uniref:Pollen-specific leucine-rich repeat extensin-like protein 1 isoform X1 n=2 Tax=Cucumis melo TaxID=3656 RepID=A0A5A7SHD6_CUCMM|nr:pollen-specific leucine-rich repeat extensin-like protein 1 isoform X1 [Cucumis melo var. makuwa]TYK12435.1 pollen-specific leucine-rich repeat extensin-like protein 1 isoform X1 [Cucumis melo var. makuwa]